MKKIKEILQDLGTDDLDKAMSMVEEYSETYYRISDLKMGAITSGTPEWNDYVEAKKNEKVEIKKFNDYKNKLKNMDKKISIEKVKNGYVISFGEWGEKETVICQTPKDVLKELGDFYEEFKKVN